MIKRLLKTQIEARLLDHKILVVYGPRQVGKTTLIQEIANEHGQHLWLNADEPDIRALLTHATSSSMKRLFGSKKLIIIDEAQRIADIGLTLKLIHDEIPDIKVIATGSSSFDLANKISEPLTGRKWEFKLFPISEIELEQHHGWLEEKRALENRLIFGLYPEVVNHPGDEKNVLNELASSYLYKDLLTWNRIQKPDRLEALLQALAHQVGQQVSYSELGQLIGLDNQTVEAYVSILEKAFVIFRLGPLSRNLRNELKKTRKIYFFDNGIRNAIIKQYNPISMRNDQGALWENFVLSERIKRNYYFNHYCNSFFWRTQNQQEIDYVEESNGVFNCYEFKWNANKKWKIPKAFAENYTLESSQIIHPENFWDILSQPNF